jgi:hypothetical protein
MDANRAALVVAKQMAIRAVKEGLRRQGVRITYVKHGDLIVLANRYLVLQHYDALFAQAAERVRLIMAEDEWERRVRRLRYLQRRAQSQEYHGHGPIVKAAPIYGGIDPLL